MTKAERELLIALAEVGIFVQANSTMSLSDSPLIRHLLANLKKEQEGK